MAVYSNSIGSAAALVAEIPAAEVFDRLAKQLESLLQIGQIKFLYRENNNGRDSRIKNAADGLHHFENAPIVQ
jgi:hypothetical protein